MSKKRLRPAGGEANPLETSEAEAGANLRDDEPAAGRDVEPTGPTEPTEPVEAAEPSAEREHAPTEPTEATEPAAEREHEPTEATIDEEVDRRDEEEADATINEEESTRPRVERAARRAAARAGVVADSVVDAGEALADRFQPVVDRVGPRVHAVRRLPRRGARASPLPNLFDLHPEARFAHVRELGLQTIPVDEIRGTAVEGPAQRGLDFLALPPMRTSNWAGRWQRVQRAVRELAILPPIDVLQTAEGYWVLDGHNRVAAALKAGQVAIDAIVTAVLLPDQSLVTAPSSLAANLEGSGQVQAAASGRLTPGSTLGRSIFPEERRTDEMGAEPDRDREAKPEPGPIPKPERDGA